MNNKIKNFFLESKQLYWKRNMLIIMVLGYASGLPHTLIFGTFTYRMMEEGVNLRDIGLFGLAALPFTLKFLWAPLVDGLKIPFLYKLLGQRRSWILLTIAIMMALMAKIGFYHPKDNLQEIVILSIIISFISATYDISYDAYRVELLERREQGAGAGISIVGYRVGILASGGLTLIIADIYNWATAFVAISLTMGLAGIFALIKPKNFNINDDEAVEFNFADFFDWLKKYVGTPFKKFIEDHHNWLLILFFTIAYKFGDALLGKMANPFYQDIGFTKTTVAEITKFYGFFTSIIGGLIGGWAVYKIGIIRSLLWFGILQAISNFTFVWQAMAGPSVAVLTTVITIENITGALGTSAFVAYLSSLCNIRFTATQYALLSSVSSLGRYFSNIPSGYLVDKEYGLGLSWEWYFIITVIISIPGIIMVKYLKTEKQMQMEKENREALKN